MHVFDCCSCACACAAHVRHVLHEFSTHTHTFKHTHARVQVAGVDAGFAPDTSTLVAAVLEAGQEVRNGCPGSGCVSWLQAPGGREAWALRV
jgi:hypothetical protein